MDLKPVLKNVLQTNPNNVYGVSIKDLKDNVGAYVDLSHNVASSDSIDLFFGGFETGFKKSKIIGDDTKPLSFFVTNASEWFKFWEYQAGLSIKIGKFSYSYSIGLGETNVSFGWNDFSVEFQSGINKIGVAYSQTVENKTAYSQLYIRTIPTLILVAVCLYASYLIPICLTPAFTG